MRLIAIALILTAAAAVVHAQAQPYSGFVLPSTPLDVGSTTAGSPGTPVSYGLQGNNLSNQTVITAPSGVELSFNQTSGFAGSITQTQTGNWGSTTIWVRIAQNAQVGTLSGDITHTSGSTSATLAVSGSVKPATVHPLQDQDPLATGLKSYVNSFTAGWEFKVNSAGVVLSELGCCVPYTGTHTVTLWDTSATSAPIVQASVTGTGGQWNWAALANPINLTNGNTYRCAVTSSGYYWASNPPSSWRPTGVIEYTRGCEKSGSTVQYPSNSPSTTYNVGCADIGYHMGATITASLNSRSLGTVLQGSAGAGRSYTLTGYDTVAKTVITAPTGVEISLNQYNSYADTLTINSTGNWGPITIWARISHTPPLGAISGDITHTSSGATSANVAVNGRAIILQTSPTSLNLGSTKGGVAGTPLSYTLSGDGLGGATTLVASSNFEISTSPGSGFSSSLSLTGTTLNQDIYVRLSGTGAGALTGSVSQTNSARMKVISLSGNVNAYAPSFTSTAATTAFAGVPYTYTLTADGAPTPTLSATQLPGWLTFNAATGELSGTPGVADIGTSGNDVQIDAANTQGSATQQFTIQVDGVAPQFTSTPVAFATVGVPYSYTLTASGTPAPTLNAGTLPSWLSFDTSTGVLSGTPPTVGLTAQIDITAANGWTPDAVQSFQIQVNGFAPVITSTPVTSVLAGQAYNYTLSATGNPAPTFTLSGNPAWLTLSGNVLSGVPQVADIGTTGSINVTAANGQGADAIQTFQIDVNGQPPVFTSNPVTTASVGSYYRYTVVATGIPTATLSASGLPAWLNFDAATGVLSGTPGVGDAGITNTFTITASNGWNPNATQSFSIDVPQPFSTGGKGGGSAAGGCAAGGNGSLPAGLLVLLTLAGLYVWRRKMAN